jgi:hypothetical protein
MLGHAESFLLNGNAFLLMKYQIKTHFYVRLLLYMSGCVHKEL